MWEGTQDIINNFKYFTIRQIQLKYKQPRCLKYVVKTIIENHQRLNPEKSLNFLSISLYFYKIIHFQEVWTPILKTIYQVVEPSD